MDIMLIILAVTGCGAVIVSIYVFTVAARTYVSEDRPGLSLPPDGDLQERNTIDRRSGKTVEFPMTVDGVVLSKNRRMRPDRRVPTI